MTGAGNARDNTAKTGSQSKVTMVNLMSESRKSGPSKAVLGTAAVSFLLGAAVVAYFTERNGKPADRDPLEASGAADTAPQSLSSTAAAPSPSPSATSNEAAAAVERVEEQQGGLDQRLAAAEQRLARLDLQAQAAAGNASRAEGLLIAFAVRRSLERGESIDRLKDQLRLRFGDAMPNSVQTVLKFSENPVTLDQLIARLDGLAPQLSDPDDGPSFGKVWNEIGSLFVIRRDSTPSPQPQKRLDRARQFMLSGRVEKAVEEVRHLPGANKAGGWIADAERYARVQNALELIETAAVVEPRLLRDGAGNRIQQLSPADGDN